MTNIEKLGRELRNLETFAGALHATVRDAQKNFEYARRDIDSNEAALAVEKLQQFDEDLDRMALDMTFVFAWLGGYAKRKWRDSPDD